GIFVIRFMNKDERLGRLSLQPSKPRRRANRYWRPLTAVQDTVLNCGFAVRHCVFSACQRSLGWCVLGCLFAFVLELQLAAGRAAKLKASSIPSARYADNAL